MRKKFTFALVKVVILLFASDGRIAGAGEKSGTEIPLYPGTAPGSEKWEWTERSLTNRNGLPMAQDVVRPVLLHYPAERSKAAGVAMIVAPGGGFRTLMMSYEGVDIARRLNAVGIDAFVLKYRLLYSNAISSNKTRRRNFGRRSSDLARCGWP